MSVGAPQFPATGSNEPGTGQHEVSLGALSPTKSGWHLLSFLDGSWAVVRYETGTHTWSWGSQRPPTSPVTGMSYLGGDVTSMSIALGRLANMIGGKLWPTFVSQLDTGGLGRGQPVVVDAQGKLQSGTTVNQGDATPINQIPSPIPPSVGNTGGGLLGSLSFLSFLGSGSFWKGIGLVLAGVLILVFAAIEFKGMI